MPRPKPQDLEAASRNAKEQTSKGVAVSQQLELLYANYVRFLFNIYIQYLTLWSPGIQCRESLYFEDDVQAINPSGDHQISKVKGFPASPPNLALKQRCNRNSDEASQPSAWVQSALESYLEGNMRKSWCT